MLRLDLLAVSIGSLLIAGFSGIQAFTVAASADGVDVVVPPEDVAILVVHPNPSNPDSCYANVASSSRIAFDADGARACAREGLAAAGAGINPASRYVFHDLFLATNAGHAPIVVHVSALTLSAEGSQVLVAAKRAAGVMLASDYAVSSQPVEIPPGESASVGILVSAGDLAGGGRVVGRVVVDAL